MEAQAAASFRWSIVTVFDRCGWGLDVCNSAESLKCRSLPPGISPACRPCGGYCKIRYAKLNGQEIYLNVKGLGEIKAVAFDIDGTLYPERCLHLSAAPHYLRHIVFFVYYGLVRSKMHRLDCAVDFRSVQAQQMARFLHSSAQEAEEKLNAIVYDGLKKNFEKIQCYKGVPETFAALKHAGLKIALLSDFPPEQKGEIWGLKPYCDVILGSEFLGALKPAAYPFLETAKRLGVAPEHVLYVGNSIKYDVAGSRRAGMKSACLLTGVRALLRLPVKGADICFTSYRQLQNILLE